jgi:hypothetical protein
MNRFCQSKKRRKKQVLTTKESFGNRYNLKFVLLALFGATMGQGVVWYTGQFYAMSFLKRLCSIVLSQVDTTWIALIMGTYFHIFLDG